MRAGGHLLMVPDYNMTPLYGEAFSAYGSTAIDAGMALEPVTFTSLYLVPPFNSLDRNVSPGALESLLNMASACAAVTLWAPGQTMAVLQFEHSIPSADARRRQGAARPRTGPAPRRQPTVRGVGGDRRERQHASRIMPLAQPNEILVSQTVRDLATGSGVPFRARGRQALKGVESEWDVFVVED
jgi:hypothetical protein